MTWRIGVDTGGTFTDVVAYQSATGKWLEKKIWSERGDPGKSLFAALESLALRLEEIELIVYGTTVVTNALIENKTSSVGLITTKGFRDVLQIARQRRDVLFDLKAMHRGPVLVPRNLCFELDERTESDGRITKAVARQAARSVFERLVGDCETVAISFLHSYANSTNEEAVAQCARESFQYVSVSSDVSPEAREYERTLTTCLNASLLPLLSKFVRSLNAAGFSDERLRLFHSAGGMVLPTTAAKFPLLLAQSGPAAGVEAACEVARTFGVEHAITLDMGGTSTDCSLLVNGTAALQMNGNVGPHQVRQPMIAVESIGAGGGSIVRFLDGGLRVGPESAGSTPGPACYTRGGQLPTITDAAAILGYFGSGAGFDRPLSISSHAALRAFQPLSHELGISNEQAAVGAIRVGSAMVARAIKRITMGRGVDARTCTLIAFGGAGPMFAGLVASEMGIRRVIVPSRSSAFSAFGCLSAEQRLTRQRTVRIKEADFNPLTTETLLREQEVAIGQELAIEESANATKYDIAALMRYSGQSHEVEVPVVRPISLSALTESFRSKHHDAYGFCLDEEWECVAFRITARTGARTPVGSIVPTLNATSAETIRRLGTTRCFFEGIGWLEVSEYKRISQPSSIEGPAIVVDEFSTVVIPPGWTGRTYDGGHIDIERCSH